MTQANDSGRGLTFFAAFGFWVLLPFPFFLLGWGFNGAPVWLPDEWDLLSLVWVVAFYVPLLLMAFIIIDSIREALVGGKQRPEDAEGR